MDKQMYKQLTAEYMRREAELLITVSELKDKIESLEKHRLELIMENGELKDMVLDNGGDYTETDGYDLREIGGDDLYKYINEPFDANQLELFDEFNSPKIYESPDGGKTVYKRKFNDYSTREKV